MFLCPLRTQKHLAMTQDRKNKQLVKHLELRALISLDRQIET